jgi:prepilin-type N-terminal cleavage/methylation domain-containing protein
VNATERGFSLVEVVIALGVISFAMIAILGLVPTGLHTAHTSQDETRAAQIAQGILSSLAGENIKLDTATGKPKLDASNHQQLNDSAKLPSVSSAINLGAPASYPMYATNDGRVSDSNTGAVYAVTLALSAAPANFDAAYAIQATVTVAWPANASAADQTRRDFVRIITAY